MSICLFKYVCLFRSRILERIEINGNIDTKWVEAQDFPIPFLRTYKAITQKESHFADKFIDSLIRKWIPFFTNHILRKNYTRKKRDKEKHLQKMGWQIASKFWSTKKYQKYFEKKIYFCSVSHKVSGIMK